LIRWMSYPPPPGHLSVVPGGETLFGTRPRSGWLLG
jgi:hypothetical protein